MSETRGKLRQRALERELTMGFAEYIKKRFDVMPSAAGIGIDLGMVESSEGLEWEHKRIKCQAAFYMNGDGHPKFFIRLKYGSRTGLGEEISSEVHSKREIDKSRYIARPIRIIGDDSYLAVCRLKNPEQEPRKNLYDHVFGYLIARPLGKIMGIR